ncbi:MAG: asparagine synthetase B, partial [Candidatus Eremiobacteraeota bacterium]|nr:asparagine synthetase B [Candidatus Eremiobacteraeota bacterium]
YRLLLSDWKDPLTLVRGSRLSAVDEFCQADRHEELLSALVAADLRLYLPDDILVKVDRASMAYGLEVRSPFLDHHLVEFALQLPARFKVKGFKGKLLLRQILASFVPASLFERPKMGFAVPLGDWLRNDLRPWAEDLLASSWLKDETLLRREPVEAVWRAHLRGQGEHHNALWSVLMLLAWLEARR